MKLPQRAWFLAFIALAALIIFASRTYRTTAQPQEKALGATTGKNPFNGQRAYEMLVQICKLGSRTSGSPGMAKQQALLKKHFASLGGKVIMQEFTAVHPITREPVPMANLIVQWHPERDKRILLCAHYDTRPFPDNDPDPALRKALFVGANDGASGVALLAELGHHMSSFDSKYGVDFVLFDGEELIFNDRDTYFLGSTYFAKSYRDNPPPYRYLAGVLFDMVGDRDLQLYIEQHSLGFPAARAIAVDIWKTAKAMGVREFIPARGHLVKDDHLPLNRIAKIPTCDIIDFDYGPNRTQTYWHTTHDTPDKCSAASLAKVGWVTLTWLQSVK